MQGMPEKASVQPRQSPKQQQMHEDAVSPGDRCHGHGWCASDGGPYGMQGMPEKQGEQTPCTFTLIRGNPTELKLLEEAGIKDADSLIVGGIEKQDSREADTIMLAMLLVLQDAQVRYKRDCRHPLHVVGQVTPAPCLLRPVCSAWSSSLCAYTAPPPPPPSPRACSPQRASCTTSTICHEEE